MRSRGARLPSPACWRQRLTQCDRRSRQSAAETLQGVPILRTAHDPYKAAAPPLTPRPYQTTTHPSPFDSTPAHEPAAGIAMVLDGGIRPHRRRDCSGRMAPQRPGLPRHGGQRRRPGAALAPRPRGSTALEGMAGSDHCMRVYAGNGDGMPR